MLTQDKAYKQDFAEMKNYETKVQKLEKQIAEMTSMNEENTQKVCIDHNIGIITTQSIIIDEKKSINIASMITIFFPD